MGCGFGDQDSAYSLGPALAQIVTDPRISMLAGASTYGHYLQETFYGTLRNLAAELKVSTTTLTAPFRSRSNQKMRWICEVILKLPALICRSRVASHQSARYQAPIAQNISNVQPFGPNILTAEVHGMKKDANTN